MRFLFASVFLVAVANASIGFDSLRAISVSQFQCMKSHGYSYFIGRIGLPNGNVDTVGIQNMRNARAGGMDSVDGFISPCITLCNSVSYQIETAVTALQNDGVQFGMIWADVGDYNWTSNIYFNQNDVREMGLELDHLGIKNGVYTTIDHWNTAVGPAFTEMSPKPLWWANYNNQANLANFKPFGGWTKPTMHEYAKDAAGPCGFNVNLNFF